METLIASPLIELLDLSKSQDPWKTSLHFLVQRQTIDPYKIESLIAPLKMSAPQSEELLTAATFLSLNESLKYELKSDVIALCDSTDPIIRELILTLLGHPPNRVETLPSFAPRELLYFGLMALSQDSEQKKKVFLQKTGEIRLLLDRNGNPFCGLLSDEKHFCLATLLSTFHLIFSLSYHFSKAQAFKNVADHLYHRLGLLEGFYLDAIPAHLLMTSLLIELYENSRPCVIDKPAHRGFYRREALLHEQLKAIDFTCQFSGEGKALGSLHKGNIEIVSMAPHKLPLGIMENFGLYRLPANGEGNFSDLNYENNSLSGWIKLCNYGTALPEPGVDWLHMELKSKPDYLTLNITPQKNTQDLYFVFFVKAKEAKIDGRTSLKPRSLERFIGETNEINFKDADEFLSIRTKEPTKIEVIPLAGGNHFWSAHYLVAFPIKSSISIEIS